MGVELTNMVMVYDKDTNKILIEHRRRSWCGITFPGGHVEDGESFYASAVREVKEETGLDIRNLQSCGIFQWCNDKTFERYVVFLYKTCDYSGELNGGSEEGEVFWVDRDKLGEMELSDGFDTHLPMFLEDKYCEAFGLWNDDVHQPIEFL